MLHSHSRTLRLCGGIIAGLALFCTGVGLPLAQMVRVQETRKVGEDRELGAAQYSIVLVLAHQSNNPKNTDSKNSDQKKEPGQDSQSRLFKPVADHWESSPNIKLPDLHVERLEILPCVELAVAALIEAAISVRPLHIDAAPPNSRGPPAV